MVTAPLAIEVATSLVKVNDATAPVVVNVKGAVSVSPPVSPSTTIVPIYVPATFALIVSPEVVPAKVAVSVPSEYSAPSSARVTDTSFTAAPCAV